MCWGHVSGNGGVELGTLSLEGPSVEQSWYCTLGAASASAGLECAAGWGAALFGAAEAL